MLAACALFPPMEPAREEPTKFLVIFASTKAATVVFSVLETTLPGTTASHTTDLPLPSILVGVGKVGKFYIEHVW